MAAWKLTDEQAAEMRRLREAGSMVQDIARMFNVSEPSVRRNLRRAGCGAIPPSFGRLRPRQRKLVEGLAAGKSAARAAADAGYSPNTAKNAGRDLLAKPGVAPALRELLAARVPNAHLAQRIREGVDAVQTEFFSHQGRVRDERAHADMGMRARYIELTAKLTGQMREQVDVAASVQVIVDC